MSNEESSPPPKVLLTDAEWKKRLTPEQYHIMREKGTERPCQISSDKAAPNVVYHCAACGLPLFRSASKFESGTGWPSFYEPIAPQNLIYREDYKLPTTRVEVLCAACESHLGHVFDDGPPPTGRRYCMNSVALKKG